MSTRPVRVTTELRGDEHRALLQTCYELAEELDRPRVAGAEVVRALLAELHENSELRTRVTGRLLPTRGQAL